jgi:Concanavalin A-like lectin/glucanases superfamily
VQAERAATSSEWRSDADGCIAVPQDRRGAALRRGERARPVDDVSSLLLVVPLVVFAVVVVLGFVGCQLPTQGTSDDYHGAEIGLAGPVAYWRLSDPVGSVDAQDEIGDPPLGTHHGTYSSNVMPGQFPGLVPGGGAHASFGGGGASVDFGWDPVFAMPSFSVEAVVLLIPDTLKGTRSIVENRSPTGAGWALGTSQGPGLPDGPKAHGFLEGRLGDDSGFGNTTTPLLLPVDPVPWHVAMTYDGPASALTVYLNGTEVAWATGLPYTPNTGPLRIGVDFLGGMQEVALYNRPLSSQEISDHFQTSQGIWPH